MIQQTIAGDGGGQVATGRWRSSSTVGQPSGAVVKSVVAEELDSKLCGFIFDLFRYILFNLFLDNSALIIPVRPVNSAYSCLKFLSRFS